MDTGQLLDLFTLGETAEDVEKPGTDSGAADIDGKEVDMVDVDGAVKEKGKKGVLDDLSELWDEKQYEEEYNLDSFLASMKG